MKLNRFVYIHLPIIAITVAVSIAVYLLISGGFE